MADEYLNLITNLGSPEGIQGIVVELEGLGVMTLTGWNGEHYRDCYQSTISGYPLEETSKSYCLEPVYAEVYEDQYTVVGYKEI